MSDELSAIEAALAELSEPDLHALIAATKPTPRQCAPDLMAWIESVCDWEMNGRLGLNYELQPPFAAIRPEERAVRIAAAIAMRTSFGEDSPEVCAFFDALVALLAGDGQKH